jgi:hypothetical protein
MACVRGAVDTGVKVDPERLPLIYTALYAVRVIVWVVVTVKGIAT